MYKFIYICLISLLFSCASRTDCVYIAPSYPLEHEIETLKNIIETKSYKDYYDTEIYKYCRITLNKTALSALHIH